MPCAELLRFCNSGSEAVHAAVRVARAATGRAKILRFEGHYHGWYDEALESAMLGYTPQYSFDKMVDSALAHQRGEAIDQIPN